MATFSSKQKKAAMTVEPFIILVSAAMIVMLLIPGSFPGRLDNSNGGFLGVPSEGSLALQPGSADVSFATDLSYWDANCGRGWDSDSVCDNIVARSQSCSLVASSAYCSEYDTYLQQFHK